MIEIKVDGYTLFELTTPRDVGYLRQQIADQKETIEGLAEQAEHYLTEIAALRDERDALKRQLLVELKKK